MIYLFLLRCLVLLIQAMLRQCLHAGHMLGVAASWLVQVGIELHRFFTSMFNPKEEDDNVDKSKQVALLARTVVVATIKCGSSLIFASIGAGIGATVTRPQAGQWIGKIISSEYMYYEGAIIYLSFCC